MAKWAKRQLEIPKQSQDAHSIEIQHVHHLGKLSKENVKDRVIIACFLRYSNREIKYFPGNRIFMPLFL